MGTVGYGQLVRQFEVDPGVTSIGQMNKMDHEDKNASSKSQIDENMNQEEKIALEMLDNVVNEADQDRTITDQDEDNVNPEVETKSFWKDLDGDKKHVAVLFFLYVLQGIPLGLHSSIPLILQNRDVAYKEQAKFSFSSYPFSMKLLWAPIVDSLFIKRFGTCDIEVEGFYYLAMGCFVIGCLWFIWGWRTMRRLQKIDVLEWRVVKKDKILNDVVSQKPAAQTEKRSRFSSLVQRMRK